MINTEEKLLAAATDCGYGGSWGGSTRCPKHLEGARFGFYNDHLDDITWRCWCCLLEAVETISRESAT